MIKQQLSLIENIRPFFGGVPWNIRHKKTAHMLTEERFHVHISVSNGTHCNGPPRNSQGTEILY